MFKIGVVAASSRVSPETVEGIKAWMAEHVPGGDPALVFHPSLHAKHGHFAGDDTTRARALVYTPAVEHVGGDESTKEKAFGSEKQPHCQLHIG